MAFLLPCEGLGEAPKAPRQGVPAMGNEWPRGGHDTSLAGSALGQALPAEPGCWSDRLAHFCPALALCVTFRVEAVRSWVRLPRPRKESPTVV